MKTIIVTGGAGCIGYHLCKRLLEEGEKVIVVDNLITGSKKNIQRLSRFSNFVFVNEDINGPFWEQIDEKSVEQIYHLACPTGVVNLTRLAEEMLLTSVIGTYNVLSYAKSMHSRVLFTSSSEVYGDPEVSPQTEEYSGNVSPVGARSPYEEGKRAAEAVCRMFEKKYGVDVRIVRVFNTYGPDFSESESRVVPNFVMKAKKGEPITIFGSGEQTRTFCYVADLIDGLVTIMKAGEKGSVYNLGDDHELAVNDVAKRVIEVTGSKSKILYKKHQVEDHHSRHPDISKVKKLGWKPTVGISEGILKTVKGG